MNSDEGEGDISGKSLHLRFDALNEKIEINSFKIEALNKKIDAVDERLSKQIAAVDENLSKKIDAVGADLSAHRRDTEAHRKGWRVSEGE